jgi:hypothetical protein
MAREQLPFREVTVEGTEVSETNMHLLRKQKQKHKI